MQTAAHSQSRHAQGFTLIELLIAIVVVGILAAVAFPSFMDAVRKSRRAEGISALNQVQQAQERFRANRTTFSTNLTALPTAAPPGLGLSATTPGGYYTISIVNAAAATYEATATAVAGTSQVDDGNCAKLGVRMNGATLEYAASTTAGALAYASSNRCWGR